MQGKLQDNIKAAQAEQQEKDKYKGLYQQYQDQVARLEAQLEAAGQQKQTFVRPGSAVTVQKQATANNYQLVE